METGGLCVMMGGQPLMLMSRVGSWGILAQVCDYPVISYAPLSPFYMHIFCHILSLLHCRCKCL